MKLSKLKVYDPPMCSSGFCSPNVDPELVRFSTDLEWLKKQGVEIERFNLSSHPAEFVHEQVVKEALKHEGNACLPLVVLDGSIVSRCVYPSRVELMAITGITGEAQDKVTEVFELLDARSPVDADIAEGSPECNCAALPRQQSRKFIAGLFILLAAVSILAYAVSILTYEALNRNPDASKRTNPNMCASTFDSCDPSSCGASSPSCK